MGVHPGLHVAPEELLVDIGVDLHAGVHEDGQGHPAVRRHHAQEHHPGRPLRHPVHPQFRLLTLGQYHLGVTAVVVLGQGEPLLVAKDQGGAGVNVLEAVDQGDGTLLPLAVGVLRQQGALLR